MSSLRQHPVVGVPFPPGGGGGGGNLGNMNGLGAMGGMGNMGGVGTLGNMGGMGGMGGAGGAGGQQQQHPGSHAPPMGLLPNPQPQQPPMSGLQPGGNQPGQNQGGMSGVPQPSLNQQPNGIPFMHGGREQVIRRLQAQAQQSQSPQQQQPGGPGGPHMPHQQGPQQGPQPNGIFPPGMSPMGNFGSSRPPSLVNAGSANGMGPMTGLGGLGGMGGVGGAGGFQGLQPGGAGAGAMTGLNVGGMRRVPSQAGQANQPQPPIGGAGNPGMNMNMLGGVGMSGVGGVAGMNNVGLGIPQSMNVLRQGAGSGVNVPPGPQRLVSYPGASGAGSGGPGGPSAVPGQLGAPGHQRSLSSMGQLPPEVAAAISQQEQRHREQQQQQQQQVHMQQQQSQQQSQGQGQQQHLGQQQHGGLPIQHPRTPSVVHSNPTSNPSMPPLNAGMNGMNNPAVNGAGPGAGGPGSMNPSAPNPMGMQRAPSAQSMTPGGMHPGLPNHPNQNPQQIPHGHQQQQANPPPFTNPLHQLQNSQIQQHSQQQHPQLGGGPQQHLGGPHGPQGPPGLSGMGTGMRMPMPGMPGAGGGMQGHSSPGVGPGQQHPMNAGSPPRPGTGGPGPQQSQPQTPSIPVSMRPQSRTAAIAGVGEQQGGPAGVIGFPAGGGQPQFGGGQMRPPGGPGHQQHPGQQGPLGPFSAPGMAVMPGRATPHPNPAHVQGAMGPLGGSPRSVGPIGGRPGSANGPPGMGTPHLGSIGGVGALRPGPVGPAGAAAGAGGGFPTPAQQLQHLTEQQVSRGMGPFQGNMGPMPGQGHVMGPPGGPASGQAPGQGQGPLGTPQRPPTSQAHPHGPGHGPQAQTPFTSPVVHQTPSQQHRVASAGSPAAHRQPTPALQQAGAGQASLGRMGSPSLARELTQQGALNRSPSRVRTPSKQMPQTPGQGPHGPSQGQGGPGPSRTPRTQAAQLPMTHGVSASGGGGPTVPNAGHGQARMPPAGMPVRQGVGLGISPMQPPSGGHQQPQPPNASAQPSQPQQQQTAGSQRPGMQDGSNPPPSMGMLPAGPYLPRQAMFSPSQGIARLLAFSESLSHPKVPPTKDFWEALVSEHFAPKALVKITLWKDGPQREAKPFDITTPILPRFFLVTSQAGVTHMSINYDGAKERPSPLGPYTSFVECADASWTFFYANGYIVTLRGLLTATLVPVQTAPLTAPGATGAQPPPYPYTMKIETITFDAGKHEKALRLDAIHGIHGRRGTPRMVSIKAETVGVMGSGTSNSSPRTGSTTIGSNSAESTPIMEEGQVGTNMGGEMVIHFERATIPTEPVNAFGVPQATMRCLELAESIGQMDELMDFTLQTGFRPLEALNKYANLLREQGYVYQPLSQSSPGQLMDANQTNGIVTSPAVTLYQSTPPVEHATANTGGLQPPPSNLRPGGIAGAGGTQGDMTSSPNMTSTPGSTQTPSAPPLSGAPTSTSSTPRVPHATLKRKAGDITSPTTSTAEHAQPPTKRAQRKRSVRGHHP